jgi:hypothetical protein
MYEMKIEGGCVALTLTPSPVTPNRLLRGVGWRGTVTPSVSFPTLEFMWISKSKSFSIQIYRTGFKLNWKLNFTHMGYYDIKHVGMFVSTRSLKISIGTLFDGEIHLTKRKMGWLTKGLSWTVTPLTPDSWHFEVPPELWSYAV